MYEHFGTRESAYPPGGVAEYCRLNGETFFEWWFGKQPRLFPLFSFCSYGPVDTFWRAAKTTGVHRCKCAQRVQEAFSAAQIERDRYPHLESGKPDECVVS